MDKSKIMVDILVGGVNGTIKKQALVDTGAEVSLMPEHIAVQIGAWETNQNMSIVDANMNTKTLPIIAAFIGFPELSKDVYKFPFGMHDLNQEIILGMDILKPTGINIDTKNNKLTVKNEIWEAFKTIAGTGLLVYGGIRIIGAIFPDTPKSRKRRK